MVGSISQVVAAALIIGASARTAAAEPTTDMFRGNIFCGPRCIQRVLQHYGQSADLYELVQEMQWPASERGASMASLGDALEKRGIHSAAVTIDRSTQITWSHPAIVVLQKDQQAHYVVWLPGHDTDSAPRIWDGALTVALNPRQFDELRSGPVLLTCDHPISDSTVVGETRGNRYSERSQLLSVVVLVGVGFGGGWLLRQFQR